ncbi:MAG: hypothetical protein V9G12_19985 [Microthrixaceae bacterium]
MGKRTHPNDAFLEQILEVVGVVVAGEQDGWRVGEVDRVLEWCRRR